jgi:hypothetical protein
LMSPAGARKKYVRWFLLFVLHLVDDFERRKQNEVQIPIWAGRGDGGSCPRAKQFCPS